MQETIITTGGSTNTVSYVWGLDLSGTLQGAGGIGGLLLRKSDTGTFAYLYDANGNIGQLVDVADGSLAARYEYDPFGKLLVADGPEAENNLYRYSTKYFMPEIGWYDYGMRPYDPELGRWPTRDPIEEQGGLNLYGFIRNNAINFYDPLGLTTVAEIMEAFFSNSTIEPLWYMDENDEYTERMRQLKVVQNKLNELKSHLGNNCEIWEKNHKTTPSWEPSTTWRK